mgnify:CR=1 FL=1
MAVESYDAMVPPDPQAWLAAGEQERIDLVRAYHTSIGDTGDNETLHCTLHTIVENQVALGGEMAPVGEKLRQLMVQGLDRHMALHAIMFVLAKHMQRLGSGHVQQDGHERRYFTELRRQNARKFLMMLQSLPR